MICAFALRLIAFAIISGPPTAGPDESGGPQAGRGAFVDRPIAHDVVTIDDDVVAGCVGCHRDGLSLAPFEAETLAAAIAAIIRGETSHVVPIAALSEEDMAALAKALAEPESPGSER